MSSTVERSTVEILKAARGRLSDPDHWYQGEYACDEDGAYIAANSERACKWCAAGAVLAELDRDIAVGEPEVADALEPLVGAISGQPPADDMVQEIASFNDDPDRTHAEILALYDRAIELAQQDGEHS